MKCYLFDIDGTVADLTHRLPHIQKTPKDWDSFFAACDEDAPIAHICDVVRLLCVHYPIVFVSGRSDQVREETMCWLNEHGIWSGHLYMRKEGDHRPDYQIKFELLQQLRADGFDPIMAFDDRNQVVEMWRANGIPCAQVADGNF